MDSKAARHIPASVRAMFMREGARQPALASPIVPPAAIPYRASRLAEYWDWYSRRVQAIVLGAGAQYGRRRVTGDSEAVVSLTTHGRRIQRVHIALESIVRGVLRPRRLILWLDKQSVSDLPLALRRLQARGLEIVPTEDYGPHTKYYPYVQSCADDGFPLVTADDDVMYPRTWLRDLVAAWRAEPDLVHCYWARRMHFDGERLAPYLRWRNVDSATVSPLHFALGVSGVIYPPELLRHLRDTAGEFLALTPRADDIWLHATALRAGYSTRKVRPGHDFPRLVPYTQDQALHLTNHLPDGNDACMRAVYRPEDLERLRTRS